MTNPEKKESEPKPSPPPAMSPIPDLKSSTAQFLGATTQLCFSAYYAAEAKVNQWRQQCEARQKARQFRVPPQIAPTQGTTQGQPNPFLRGAVIGYVLGVIGTRRILVKPLICAAVFGWVWQKAGFRI